jgi:hypothetical protein
LQIFVARAFFWQRESILLTPNSQNAQEAVKTKTTAILIKKTYLNRFADSFRLPRFSDISQKALRLTTNLNEIIYDKSEQPRAISFVSRSHKLKRKNMAQVPCSVEVADSIIISVFSFVIVALLPKKLLDRNCA